jgi:GGDEF domain-containing protein
MDPSETLSAVRPMLRHRWLRLLLLCAPGVMAGVSILAASQSSPWVVIALNAIAGLVTSSVLFIGVSLVARRATAEQVNLARAAELGFWRARTHLLSILDESGLYTHWYFRLRLQEEVERSRRYGLHFVVVIVKALALHQDVEVSTASEWFSERVQRHVRKADLAGLLQDGSLAILLPNTSRRSALLAKKRLEKELSAVRPRIGIACFPEDSDDAGELLAQGAHGALEANLGVA